MVVLNHVTDTGFETYLSPVETHCINIEYFLADVDNQTKGFSEDAMTRLRYVVITLSGRLHQLIHRSPSCRSQEEKRGEEVEEKTSGRMSVSWITGALGRSEFNKAAYWSPSLDMGRAAIALFIVAFFSIFVAFWTGITGCWRRSPGNITATAILILLACLLSAGAMGLWHGVEYYERERVVGEEFYQQWNNVLRAETRQTHDWSYVMAWTSVALTFISSVMFFCAAYCMRSERRQEAAKNVQYIMPGA
ncbi:hypothetical protein J6590_039482 [Homalodisca vitripennis]|nr:hypothetical protein J6590_039482 [Homalodisca vitripennis]